MVLRPQMTSYGKLEPAVPLASLVIHVVFDNHCHLRARNRNYGDLLCGDGMTELQLLSLQTGLLFRN
jgi:hypothetical protein